MKKTVNKAPQGFGVGLITCPSAKEAEMLARGILEKRLAACVNVVPQIDSYFWWEGKIDHAQEALLMVKTHNSRWKALEQYVKSHHGYQVPEIIFLPLGAGHAPYLNWVMESLKSKR